MFFLIVANHKHTVSRWLPIFYIPKKNVQQKKISVLITQIDVYMFAWWKAKLIDWLIFLFWLLFFWIHETNRLMHIRLHFRCIMVWNFNFNFYLFFLYFFIIMMNRSIILVCLRWAFIITLPVCLIIFCCCCFLFECWRHLIVAMNELFVVILIGLFYFFLHHTRTHTKGYYLSYNLFICKLICFFFKTIKITTTTATKKPVFFNLFTDHHQPVGHLVFIRR